MPKTAGAVCQDTAQAESDGRANRCVQVECLCGAFQHDTVVLGQIILEVCRGELGKLVVLRRAAEGCEGHLDMGSLVVMQRLRCPRT